MKNALLQLSLFDQLDQVESRRLIADHMLPQVNRGELGQFMTPAPVARFMASLFNDFGAHIRLLDPGAGVGSLATAFISRAINEASPQSISVAAYEIDALLASLLSETLDDCGRACAQHSIELTHQVFQVDFIEVGVQQIVAQRSPSANRPLGYTHVIMNPPYRKIHRDSNWRAALQRIGIETSNLYTAFLALAAELLAPGGELVAIVPRSFCNGVYFTPFRDLFLREMAIKHLHVFEARDRVFAEGSVLQENIILHATKSNAREPVLITSSHDAELQDLKYRKVGYNQVVKPGDPLKFINIAVNDSDQLVIDRLSAFNTSLASLGISVSTGPVVDFRLKDNLRSSPESGTHPLIYPGHIRHHFVEWPDWGSRKPNAIAETEHSNPYLMPNGWYVLVRRFSAKEEKRRVVAAIHRPDRVQGSKIGFENHLNVLHCRGQGLDPALAKGLAVYLNSTLVDLYFRQFSGHTQVNATDLRSLRYPSADTLRHLGNYVQDSFPSRSQIDNLIEVEANPVLNSYQSADPARAARKIDDALTILSQLGMPKQQRNERSALTLLALTAVTPASDWKDAQSPLMGITPIMEFAQNYYGRTYAPNTRETFRRFTMHQFVQAGIAVANPDAPLRPVNSPKWVYQIAPRVLELVRDYDHEGWQGLVASYLKEQKSLAEQYAHERDIAMVPLIIKGGSLNLSPGSHSELIRAIIEEFGPRFAPGAEVLYVGDTGSKMIHFDEQAFAMLGLSFDLHGKFPDVVLYYRAMNWLFLIEAVTSHGPVDPKRHAELEDLFATTDTGIVYVTAFPNRKLMARYLADIGWETEVWVADAPSHLIHFNGERFLGPRPASQP
jgi:adenine-specific DNA-methyltransferase